MTEKPTWGGSRANSGRPKQDEIRKRRCLVYFDEEWDTIRGKAAAKGMSPREYLYWLVENDKAKS
ncbi:MAG: hypothetical protein FWF29_11210 [Treponema sp.]|nr:hypothetical protein [Treponema sp.]